MADEPKTVVAMLREDEMMVIILSAFSSKKPPEGIDASEALDGWPDDILDMANDAVKGIMSYFAARMTEGGAPPGTVSTIRQGGTVQ